LAATVVGRLVERHSELKQTLDRWAVDDDFWVRRSAMLALLVLLRGGEGDWPRFTRYADSMLEEKEFFIRKAVGWVLRDTSKKRPGLVLAYLTSPAKRGGPPRAALMAGLTYREATRQLPPQMQARAAAARETEA
jgi:3-methyladenine DNA glycosylase AlkD